MANGNSIPKLVGSVLACEAVGGIGAIFTSDGLKEWYPALEKPSFNPPGRVFGPVWTTLYAMMGVAFYLVSQQEKSDEGLRRTARVLFGVQLILNLLWSYIFFGRRAPGWALVEIVCLWVSIVATIAVFSKVSGKAAMLMVPYLLWTSFATVLNFSIWRLNK